MPFVSESATSNERLVAIRRPSDVLIIGLADALLKENLWIDRHVARTQRPGAPALPRLLVLGTADVAHAATIAPSVTCTPAARPVRSRGAPSAQQTAARIAP